MEHGFYDMKLKKKVSSVVTGRREYRIENKSRYMLCSELDEGRTLWAICSKADFDKFNEVKSV